MPLPFPMVRATLPPLSFGPGKLGTPLERIQCENLSAWARKLEDWAAVGALGASALHAFCAAGTWASWGRHRYGHL